METPLYLTAEQAAELAGVGVKTMRQYMDSDDPPPYLRIGRKRLVQAARLAEYLERKQEVRI